ncbi:MAG: NTP transferase domain-containing protein [Candidatus Cloacimonetes bacterium]|nr:NTP transferase domain-containing protein [Candidatus Cloacimonadota bacterium]MBL7086404.1 NTP transferase domain-containing protein [Candidatus Cloacimonadota bacterium]
MKAIILAGGKGTRLKPYTTNFPKPLMPIGDKPILEIVINRLKEAGIKDIIITTGHLSEMIRTFFGDGYKFGVNIEYSIEDKPLGTAGPIKLLKDGLKENFLVMNGDVLSDINYSKIIDSHIINNNIATVGVVLRHVHVDFGLVDVDTKNNFLSWKEKPTIEYLVSMGIYVFSPDALKYLPSEDFFNLPDFIQRLKKNEVKIRSYLHKGYWLDIGRPADYEKACNDFEGSDDAY